MTNPSVEKNISRNLLGHVSQWQAETIDALKANRVDFFDMEWSFQGMLFRDCRNTYASRSDYFRCLFSTEMRKCTEEVDGVTAYTVSDPMSKRHIFDMMRIFCHTGIVQVDKGEPILRTMERYSAFHYYGLGGGMDVIRQLVMDVINPTNAMQALDYAMNSPVCSSDTRLLADIKDYIAIYAFVVFKHKSFFSIGSESIPGISQICARDDLNIKEIDLLRCIYRLCDRKVATDKGLEGLGSAWELMTHRFSQTESSSLWDQVRLSSITMQEFVKFIKENKDCFSSDAVVKIITFLYSCAETSPDTKGAAAAAAAAAAAPGPASPSRDRNDRFIGAHASKKRKTFQAISFYPRNLEFHGLASPQTDISYWDDSKIKLFFAFDSAKREAMTLPPVHFRNFFIRCTVHHADKSLNVSGSIHGRSVGAGAGAGAGAADAAAAIDAPVTITSSVVNFRHDRWRKKSVASSLASGAAFKIPSILSWNTIENNDTLGYLFDIEKYPEYSPKGTWILLQISIER